MLRKLRVLSTSATMYVALKPPQTPMEGVENLTVAKIEHVLTVSVSGGYEGNIDGPGGARTLS